MKKTKIELALEMISEDKARGIEFGWVNADALYGNSSLFCNTIEDMGDKFVVDIHKDQNIYISDPKPEVPEQTSKKGRNAIYMAQVAYANNILSKLISITRP